jgi:hypothetical protein
MDDCNVRADYDSLKSYCVTGRIMVFEIRNSDRPNAWTGHDLPKRGTVSPRENSCPSLTNTMLRVAFHNEKSFFRFIAVFERHARNRSTDGHTQ